jgi:hypothetical protein
MNNGQIEGPTDSQFRMGAIALLPIVLIGMAVSAATWNGPSMSRLIVLGLGPFAVFYSIAALFDPNIVRAAGKFGAHLPPRYKIIAAVIGLGALIAAGLVVLPLLMR